jgi:hypothetical protein
LYLLVDLLLAVAILAAAFIAIGSIDALPSFRSFFR